MYFDSVENVYSLQKNIECKRYDRLYDIIDLSGKIGEILYDKNFCKYTTSCGETLFNMIRHDKTAATCIKYFVMISNNI